MAIKLYGAALSPFVRKVRVVLAEKDIPFESVHVDPFNAPEDYGNINPLRRIPAMEHDGRLLADSAVICTYLERAFPETPALYPMDAADHAHALWLEKYADYELAPLTTFTVFRNRVIMKLMGKASDEERIERALTEKLPPHFAYLETQIEGREWLAGDQLSVADIAVASQFVNFAHGGEKLDPQSYPALAAHVDKVLARPTFTALLERENSFVAKLRGG